MQTEVLIKQLMLQRGIENNYLKLKPMQLLILDKLEENSIVYVFDEVGCGKTISAGLAIWKVICEEQSPEILVITDYPVIKQYITSLENFFGFQLKYIKEDNQKTYFEGKYVNLIISNPHYANIAKLNDKWDLIVIDEAHLFHNNSYRTEFLSNKYSEKVVILTATPIKDLNKRYNLEFLAEDIISAERKKTFGLEDSFKISTISYWMKNYKEIVNITSIGELNEITDENYTLQYKRAVPIVLEYQYLEEVMKALPESTPDIDKGNLYFILKENKMINELYDDFFRYKTKDKLEKLRKYDSKVDILIKQITKIIDSNGKTIIFFTRKWSRSYIESVCEIYFPNKKIGCLHGDMSSEEKENTLKKIYDIFLIMGKVGSVGLNLPNYNYVINYELTTVAADLEQRFGRIDRPENEHTELHMIYLLHKECKQENHFDNGIYKKAVKNYLEILKVVATKNSILDERLLQEYFGKLSSMELKKITNSLLYKKGGKLLSKSIKELVVENKDRINDIIDKYSWINDLNYIKEIYKNIQDYFNQNENNFIDNLDEVYNSLEQLKENNKLELWKDSCGFSKREDSIYAIKLFLGISSGDLYESMYLKGEVKGDTLILSANNLLIWFLYLDEKSKANNKPVPNSLRIEDKIYSIEVVNDCIYNGNKPGNLLTTRFKHFWNTCRINMLNNIKSKEFTVLKSKTGNTKTYLFGKEIQHIKFANNITENCYHSISSYNCSHTLSEYLFDGVKGQFNGEKFEKMILKQIAYITMDMTEDEYNNFKNQCSLNYLNTHPPLLELNYRYTRRTRSEGVLAVMKEICDIKLKNKEYDYSVNEIYRYEDWEAYEQLFRICGYLHIDNYKKYE